MLVAHGWNVDYSVFDLFSFQYCSSERGTHDLRSGRGRARCWVSEGAALLVLRLPAPVNSCFGGVMGGWSLFENCTVDASICGQVFKGARWMPWHQEPMKDVGGHDSPRGVVNQALIRGFRTPSRHGLSPLPEHIGHVEGTRGSETSQYPQEEKTTVIPGVVASETG